MSLGRKALLVAGAHCSGGHAVDGAGGSGGHALYLWSCPSIIFRHLTLIHLQAVTNLVIQTWGRSSTIRVASAATKSSPSSRRVPSSKTLLERWIVPCARCKKLGCKDRLELGIPGFLLRELKWILRWRLILEGEQEHTIGRGVDHKPKAAPIMVYSLARAGHSRGRGCWSPMVVVVHPTAVHDWGLDLNSGVCLVGECWFACASYRVLAAGPTTHKCRKTPRSEHERQT
jgi:hypothetical protein